MTHECKGLTIQISFVHSKSLYSLEALDKRSCETTFDEHRLHSLLVESRLKEIVPARLVKFYARVHSIIVPTRQYSEMSRENELFKKVPGERRARLERSPTSALCYGHRGVLSSKVVKRSRSYILVDEKPSMASVPLVRRRDLENRRVRALSSQCLNIRVSTHPPLCRTLSIPKYHVVRGWVRA